MSPYRYQQAPWGFKCDYRHCCPHLQGLSTKWVFDEYQRSSDEHLEHWRIRDIQQEQLEEALSYIAKLEKENEDLKARLKALHQRQFKPNIKHKAKSPDEKSAAGKKKKRGAPRGHPGWHRRKPDHIDKTVIVPAPEVCPHCACTDLTPVEG